MKSGLFSIILILCFIEIRMNTDFKFNIQIALLDRTHKIDGLYISSVWQSNIYHDAGFKTL